MKTTRNDIVLNDGTVIEAYDIDFETDEEKREWDEYRQWCKQVGCKCPEHLERDAHYVPDGVSDVCDKHHWVCNRCGGIVQIG